MNAAFDTGEKILTVTQFNRIAKAVIENEPVLKGVCVLGEISGFRRYPSGHLYFTVKDEGSALSCVMFASSAASLKFLPADGMRVRIYGGATIYEKDGRYQYMVRRMVPDGAGGLYAAFERLKKKLEGEGLFDPAHKKSLPAFPRTVGVITSSAGAALHDILSVTGRRFPCARIVVYPSAVQGEEAPEQLCRAVGYFTRNKNVDVLIIGRGGGSIEDLWAFNDETLARALFACPIPTISAVGHETDFTICDFVCDLRAPTPSAAAELAVPDRDELLLGLAHASRRIDNAVRAALLRRRKNIEALSSRGVLRDARSGLRVKRRLFEALCQRYRAGALSALQKKRAAYAQAEARLRALDPLSVLSRGYAAVFGKDGDVVRSAKALNKDDRLTLRFCDGSALVSVENTEERHG